ncbi:hypothetical protein [Burkholderia gladioli]|uniref:hypothetical protein n=1 Tax=Burkholderia gladioli TaxID=28095 RepID=UPI00163E634C|nr:hypothetical protein [Burkholderia gladioli]MBU9174009.1 hypothetical protein [Burkholderia gladioli]
MKRFLSWFRRRVLVRVSVQRGLVLRPGDTVMISVPRDEKPILPFDVMKASLEERYPGIKFLYVADLGRVFVLGCDLGGRGGGKNGERGSE